MAAMKHSEEVALVERCRAGDRQAAAELVEKYRPWLVRQAARRLNGNVDLAEDVAQEVIIRAVTARRPYDGRAALATWLYRILANECSDAIRRGPAAHEMTLGQEEWQHLEKRAAVEETGEALMMAAASLDDRLLPLNRLEREVVRRCYVDGHRIADVAQQLGLTHRQVARHLEHARHRLGGRLGPGKRSRR